MEYTLTVHENKPYFKRVTVGEQTYHLINWDEDGKHWTVCDFEECPVSDREVAFVMALMKAWRLI